jgi:hypothetical protein
MAPSIDSQLQSRPTNSSYPSSAFLHAISNTPAFVHSRNRRWADELEQIPVAFSAFHWHPVRSTKRMAFIAARSGTRGLWQPSGCGLPAGISGSSCRHKISGIRHPSSRSTSPMEKLVTDRDRHGKKIHAFCIS